jgi:hypothetical protein
MNTLIEWKVTTKLEVHAKRKKEIGKRRMSKDTFKKED